MSRRLPSAASLLLLLPVFAAANAGLIQVTSVRSWSHPGSTRVILETSGPFEFRSDHAENPDRLFFDLLHARPWIGGRRYITHQVNDSLVHRVRIAEPIPGTTRVVFDLTGPATFKVSRLNTPDRMVIEILPVSRYISRPQLLTSAISPYSRRPPFVYPPKLPARSVVMSDSAPALEATPISTIYFAEPVLILAMSRPPKAQRGQGKRAVAPPASSPAAIAATTKVLPAPNPVTYERSSPSENSARSLTRALGLKVNRVVIDAGHGGHDDGTIGVSGVLEKDVVLDVSLRLAKLVQSRMGAEVVLTRSDDTFIPLHERTAIANSRKADLFLSIHANSSPASSVAGTEAFFLNFTNSASALDVASRENAGSAKSVGELKDLIQSITLNDKIAESQAFAQTLESSLFTQAAKSNATARDRGVKRAPFVVLIGASMPSVLAEIGFLSNARDEQNLNKPEYRQKIAEALYKGVSEYSRSLSHFEVVAAAN